MFDVDNEVYAQIYIIERLAEKNAMPVEQLNKIKKEILVDEYPFIAELYS